MRRADGPGRRVTLVATELSVRRLEYPPQSPCTVRFVLVSTVSLSLHHRNRTTQTENLKPVKAKSAVQTNYCNATRHAAAEGQGGVYTTTCPCPVIAGMQAGARADPG